MNAMTFNDPRDLFMPRNIDHDRNVSSSREVRERLYTGLIIFNRGKCVMIAISLSRNVYAPAQLHAKPNLPSRSTTMMNDTQKSRVAACSCCQE